MTWVNFKRTKRRSDNRRDHHQGLLDAARTPSERFWRAAGWLISEARKADRVDDATETLMAKVNEIREMEARDDNRNDYAA